jgi:hypothetical protein
MTEVTVATCNSTFQTIFGDEAYVHPVLIAGAGRAILSFRCIFDRPITGPAGTLLAVRTAMFLNFLWKRN